MLPFLSLHALVAQRGDGLHPKLLATFERYARSGTGLAAIIESDETEQLTQMLTQRIGEVARADDFRDPQGSLDDQPS